MRALALVALAMVLGSLVGCTSLKPSTPAPTAASATAQVSCIALQRERPSPLPDGAVPFPHDAPYALLPADSAAALLVPLPFVSEIVSGAIAKSSAADYQPHMADIDPLRSAAQALSLRPALTQSCAEPKAQLRTQVFLMESHDGLYRLSLLFDLQIGNWTGRYYDHLPTPLTQETLTRMPESARDQLRSELAEGSRLLVGLIERDLRGELPAHGAKYRVGSLYLAGGNVAGLVAPERLVYPGAELLESDDRTVLFRMGGDVSAPGQAGALLFGVHHFRRNQLHHFAPQ